MFSKTCARLIKVGFLAATVAVGHAFLIPTSACGSAASAEAENAFFTGSHLLSKGNFSGAVAALEKALELDSGNAKYRQVLAVAYNNLGLKLNREGSYGEAVRALGHALNLAPEDKDIRSNFIAAAFHAANAADDKVAPPEKANLLRRVLEIQPNSPATKKALAALLNNSGVEKGRKGDRAGDLN
jgi:tetratricopeptide (TPR) repeat protein